MMSELFAFAVSVFVLKKFYRRKKRTVSFNESIKTLSKAVEIVQKKRNFSNNYIPKYTPPEERDFSTYLDDLKYEKFMKNTDQSFKKTKIGNFDIIHHQCRGDKMEHSESYYQTIFKKNLEKHKKQDKKIFVLSALRNQKELQQEIFCEKKLVSEHFQDK